MGDKGLWRYELTAEKGVGNSGAEEAKKLGHFFGVCVCVRVCVWPKGGMAGWARACTLEYLFGRLLFRQKQNDDYFIRRTIICLWGKEYGPCKERRLDILDQVPEFKHYVALWVDFLYGISPLLACTTYYIDIFH